MQPLGTHPVSLNTTVKTNLPFVMIAITFFFLQVRQDRKSLLWQAESACETNTHMCSSILAPDKLSLVGHLPDTEIPGSQARSHSAETLSPSPHLWIFSPHPAGRATKEHPPSQQHIPGCWLTASSAIFKVCSCLMLTFQTSSALVCSVQPGCDTTSQGWLEMAPFPSQPPLTQPFGDVREARRRHLSLCCCAPAAAGQGHERKQQNPSRASSFVIWTQAGNTGSVLRKFL